MGKKMLSGIIFFLLGLSVFLMSCQQDTSSEIHVDDTEREVTNLFKDWVSDGQDCYCTVPGNRGTVIYRMEENGNNLIPNCDDLLCKHDNPSCSAYVGGTEGMDSLHRDGDQVYYLGNNIYQIEKNKKTSVATLPQRYGPDVLFYPYVAYFAEQDAVVIKNLETEKEVKQFENITGYTQGNFFYKDSLYYVTAELQFVRLDLNTGEREVLEKKGATRASVFDDQIYYVKVGEGEENCLIRMNPDTGEKEEVLQNVFYYNMMDEWMYYSSYPERKLYRCQLDGSNTMEIPITEGLQAGVIWTLPELGKILVDFDDYYTVYSLDAEKGSIDFENPVCKPQEEG